jgi:NAD-dependent deacetylase
LDYPLIVILTGAGISAESGLKTFRDQNGLWEDHSIEDVASIEGFRRNPQLVQDFYNDRRAQLYDSTVQPNAAHLALADLEDKWPGEVMIVTQNVDDLHERAGSSRVIHMHGELNKVRCVSTGKVYTWRDSIEPETECPCCSKSGTLRPDIVWFGEMPMRMDEIFEKLRNCDLFISIGTSGQVYPAAGFVNEVPSTARTIEINPEPSSISYYFEEARRGSASLEVPRLVAEILENL